MIYPDSNQVHLTAGSNRSACGRVVTSRTSNIALVTCHNCLHSDLGRKQAKAHVVAKCWCGTGLTVTGWLKLPLLGYASSALPDPDVPAPPGDLERRFCPRCEKVMVVASTHVDHLAEALWLRR